MRRLRKAHIQAATLAVVGVSVVYFAYWQTIGFDRALRGLGEDYANEVRSTVKWRLRHSRPSLGRLVSRSGHKDPDIRRGAVTAIWLLHDDHAAVVTAVGDPDARVRQRAVYAIGMMRDKSLSPCLVAALQDPGPDVRLTAAEGLGRLQGREFVRSLIVPVSGKPTMMHKTVVTALGKWKDAGTVASLMGILRRGDGDCELQALAASALAKIAAPESLPLLLSFVQRSPAHCPHIASSSVTDTPGTAPGLPPICSTAPFEVVGCLGKMGPRGTDALVSLLEHRDAGIRVSVVDTLREVNPMPSISVLIPLLKDPDIQVRQHVVSALGASGDRRAVPVLIPLLRTGRPDQQKVILDALGDLRDSRAVEEIVRIAGSPDPQVRLKAVGALKSIGDRRAVDVLVAALSDDNTGVRQEAAGAFCRLPDSRAVTPLIKLLGDKDRSVREGATMSLSYIGDHRAAKPLLGMLNDPESGTRMTVILSLGRLGDKSAADPLIRILHAGRSDERWAAARALGWIGDRRAVPGLTRALRSRDNDLRWQAAESLGEMRDPRAVKPLISLISRHRHARGDIVCGCEEASISLAAWALSMIGGSEAEGFLVSSMKERKTLVVSGAYAYFIEKGIPGSEAELIKSLNEDGLASTARHFLHSGNPKLAEAAKQWAERHPDEKKLVYKDVPQDQPRWGRRTLKWLPNDNCSGI